MKKAAAPGLGIGTRRYRAWAAACVAVLLLCLLPLLYISRYDYASADDYSYAVYLKDAWQQTHSWPAMLGTAVEQTAAKWRGWQGIYFATFLTFLDPLLLGEEHYGIGACVTLALFVLAIFYCADAVLRRTLGCEKRGATAAVAAVAALLLLEKMPVPAEAFYWWPGAVYMLGFSLALVCLGKAARLVRSDGGRIRDAVFCSLLGWLVGGANLNISLVYLELLALLLLFAFWRKRPGRIALAAVFAVSLCGFLLAALAPGNFSRRGDSGSSVLAAILDSFAYVLHSLRGWLSAELILAALFLLPLFCALPLQRFFIRRRWQLCLLALAGGGLAFCLTASSVSVVFFGVSYFPGRAVNTAYCWFVVLFFAWEWLLTQCARGVFAVQSAGTPAQAAEHKWYVRWLTPWLLCVTAAAGLLLVGCVLGRDHDRLNSLTAVVSLHEGEAQAYGAAHADRVQRLETCTVEDLRVPYIEEQPRLLYFSDIFGPNDWRNKAVAAYYGIPIVHLI